MVTKDIADRLADEITADVLRELGLVRASRGSIREKVRARLRTYLGVLYHGGSEQCLFLMAG